MAATTPQFTQNGHHVLALAQEEAEKRGRKYVDTEDILLALLHEEDGVAGDILRALGLDGKQVEDLLSKMASSHFSSGQMVPAISFQPLLILDENGKILVSNEPARDLLANDMDELDERVRSITTSTKIEVGNRTYLALSGRLSELRTIVILRDITEATKRDLGYRELLAALLYDIKMPLIGIIAYTELIEHVAQLDDTGKRAVKGIRTFSTNIETQVSDISKLAKEIHSGQK